MSKKIQYPNPKFFKMKDSMDYKLQLDNLKTFFGIAKDIWNETDWDHYKQHRIDIWKAYGKRVKDEYQTVKNMSAAEKLDLLLHGEKHLGKLYLGTAMTTVRREWRGLRDTAYDFYEWARMWGMFLATFSKDLIPSLGAVFRYRWMISYFNAHYFMDKLTMGMRGSNLRMSHELIFTIFRYVAENLVLLSKADSRLGNCAELNKKLVLFDEMTMGQLMCGFPDLIGIPYQLLPVFLVSEIDQLICTHYIDAIEEYGLPSDTCPVPTSECGVLVVDQLPHCGCCFISSSMPCDGSVMASSYVNRRFPNLPVFHLAFPVRYLDETNLQCGADDIKECIKFVENVTGSKWNWDAYFTCMKRFNRETQYELEKWDINKTAYPQLIGPAYELFRKMNYEMDGGADPRFIDTCEKVSRILNKAYKNKEEAWPGKMKYRAIVWSCPPHYFSNFSNWAANCWGIDVLVEMEGLNFTKPLETEDHEEALRDLARLYERMVMRRHTNGGYQNVVTELWKQCEAWNVKLVMMYQHVACKNMATVQGIFDDQARERGIDLIWIEHDLMDPRTVSRRNMRGKVSNFMSTVYGAKPVDESLVEFDDAISM